MPNTPELNPEEIEEIFERSSGPGGQNVNKTSTKVILRHKPTGIAVTVQDTRSQAQNRKLARERLAAAIQERADQKRAAEVDAREKARRRNAPRPRAVKKQFVEIKRHRARTRKNRRLTRDE